MCCYNTRFYAPGTEYQKKFPGFSKIVSRPHPPTNARMRSKIEISSRAGGALLWAKPTCDALLIVLSRWQLHASQKIRNVANHNNNANDEDC